MKVKAHGVEVHVDIQGAGTPLLLVHGWGGTSDSLATLASQLQNSKIQTILVDLPGFGQSDIAPAQWGTADYANCICDILDALKLKDVDYFGHSYGGALGIYLGAKHPNRIRHLILCNSSFKRPNKKSRLLFFKHLMRPFAGIAPTSVGKLRILLYRIFFRSSDVARYPHLESVFKNIVSHDLTPLVPQIKAPTLILWGENDKVTPLAWAHQLHETIAGSKLVIVPGQRHGMPLRAPELLTESISTFLHSQ